MISKQRLAIMLSKLAVFENADARLEQYPTDSEVAASALWDAYMAGDIQDRTIADFGCGTGILGIGALALGAKHVCFVELDVKVFPVLMANLHRLEEELGEEYSNYDIIQGNVQEFHRAVDVVLQNPPFGTRQEHADLQFLEKAATLAPTIYSFHKSSTVEYLEGWAARHGLRLTGKMRFGFPLKQAMKHHTRRLHRIDVMCLRLQQ